MVSVPYSVMVIKLYKSRNMYDITWESWTAKSAKYHLTGRFGIEETKIFFCWEILVRLQLSFVGSGGVEGTVNLPYCFRCVP